MAGDGDSPLCEAMAEEDLPAWMGATRRCTRDKREGGLLLPSSPTFCPGTRDARDRGDTSFRFA